MRYMDIACGIYRDYLQNFPQQATFLVCGMPESFLMEVKSDYPEWQIFSMKLEELEDAVVDGTMYSENTFNGVIVGRIFEYTKDVVMVVTRLKYWLKADGNLLGIFGNIRHWSVGEEWCSGHWRQKGDEQVLAVGIRQFFALPEIIALCQTAGFEHIEISQIFRPGSQEISSILQLNGLVNENNDLDTEFWLIYAESMDAETVWLRKFYTPEIRKTLVRILRRIDADIDVEKNIACLWKICQEAQVNGEYLVRLIRNTMLLPEHVLQSLAVQIEGDLR